MPTTSPRLLNCSEALIVDGPQENRLESKIPKTVHVRGLASKPEPERQRTDRDPAQLRRAQCQSRHAHPGVSTNRVHVDRAARCQQRAVLRPQRALSGAVEERRQAGGPGRSTRTGLRPGKHLHDDDHDVHVNAPGPTTPVPSSVPSTLASGASAPTSARRQPPRADGAVDRRAQRRTPWPRREAPGRRSAPCS